MSGGIIFSTSQSGTAQREWLTQLQDQIKTKHSCSFHDVGTIMEDFARDFDPGINWDRILDRPEQELRFHRAQAFAEINSSILSDKAKTHLIGCHLSFRWRAYLMRGIDPHFLWKLRDYLRLFFTIIDDVDRVYSRLASTEWGERKRLELAVARDEEVFITSLLADVFRKPHYIISRNEPAANMAGLVLAPWKPKIYLSFPITGFIQTPQDAEDAKKQIQALRDTLRQWATVFDPFAIQDYDLTYQVPEMKDIRGPLGEQTEHRDFRLIDQSEVIVAFYPRTSEFPKSVQSKGVDAELRHAKTTGKIIYLCHPDPSSGPFSVVPDYSATDAAAYTELLASHFSNLAEPRD